MRQVVLVVGVAAAGVVVAAIVAVGPWTLGDGVEYPRVVRMIPATEVQP